MTSNTSNILLARWGLILAVDVGSPPSRVMNYHSLLVTPASDGERSMKCLGFIIQQIEILGIGETRSSRKTAKLV
jgi:hypothetical protein